MDVFLVGPVPTPAVAHLTRTMGAAAGIMLTASHNPFDDNGIKIFGSDGYKLRGELEEVIERHVIAQDLKTDHVRTDMIGKAYRVDDARGRYIEYAKNVVGNQRLDGLKIVLDCANGAAYQIGPMIFKELGAQVTKIGVDPDGLNINERCGALYAGEVAKVVLAQGADIGIAFDGDADRVIFADANGCVVDGDQILGAVSIALKKEGKLAKDTLVTTVMSNLGLHEAMHRHKINVSVTSVGDIQVIGEMRKHGYSFGGENSGHLIFADCATTGDGILSALKVLSIMKSTGRTLAQVSDCMTFYPQVTRNLYVDEKLPLEELTDLQKVLKACHAELGDKGRTLVRYSGTEKKLRLLVECPEASQAEQWMKKLVDAITKPLNAREKK
jgi:phosphoglucosamine mutase